MSVTQHGSCSCEWSIHNFSCWYLDMHNVLFSGWFLEKYNLKMDLFPQSRDGHLVVTCSGPYIDSNLSFHAPDGSLIFEQTLNWWDDEIEELDVERIPKGPKLQEVLARIKQCEARHGDRLALRFSISKASKPSDPKFALISSQVLHSRIEIVETNLKVRVSQFRSLMAPSRIASLYYPASDGFTEEINLFVHDKHESGLLYFKLDPTDHPVAVRVHASVIDKGGAVIRTEVKENFFWWREGWTFSNSLWLQEARQMELSLVLRFKIVPYLTVKRVHGHYSTHPPIVTLHDSVSNNIAESQLVRDLRRLHADEEFADFEIKCRGVSFPVHKNVLSVRSPVFKAMFSSNLKEAESGAVTLDSVDAPTFRLFLNYLYKGTLEGVVRWESAIELYSVADEYQVLGLKKACADFLSANVSVVNVSHVTHLGFLHRDYQLKSAALEFFLNNEDDVWDPKNRHLMKYPLPLTVMAECAYQKSV